MQAAYVALAFTVILFLALLVCLDAGYRLGRRRVKAIPGSSHEGLGAIEASVFGLLGLLLAFSLSGAMTRLDTRRTQVVDEANAIGTAYLRVDLLPAANQPPMRQLFRQYLDARLEVYARMSWGDDSGNALARAAKLQQEIWTSAVADAPADPSHNVGRLLLPALNQMIDITTTRFIASRIHLPGLILALMGALALLSGLLAGYAMSLRRVRSWLHMLLYAAAISITIYTVVDLDYPRAGFIRVNVADQALRDLRDSIR